MNRHNSETRQKILRAALKRFAHGGYAATSVQDIVDAAEVSKPTLYYYFADKADLYQALVDTAHDERFHLMQAAAARSGALEVQLEEVLCALLDFARRNQELMRIAFATAFAAPGELPKEIRYLKKCERNFEWLKTLIEKGLADGTLDRRFDSRELAYGLYGQLNFYVMTQLLLPAIKLNRRTAQRVVELFLAGAAAKKKKL